VTDPRRRFVAHLDSWSALAACAWIGAYLIVAVTGQQFDTAYLGFGWQLIPWDILSNDPLRSVWYLHVQPPGWNLLLGGLAKISPFTDAITLQVLMAAFGAAVAYMACRLGRRLGLSSRAALVIALLATLHPEVLKGAFEPNYELGVAALVLAFLLAVARLADGRPIRRALMWVSVALTALVMTRSLYHPLFLLVVVASVAFAYRKRIDRRTMAAVLAIPLVVVGGWMAKNEVLFGTPTLSSWFGMNLQRAVIPVLPLDELEAMHEKGEVSDIAMIGPFGNYGLYEPVVEPCAPKHSHRSLVEPMRTTDPYSPNFNYECFLPVFEQAGSDAWAVIKAHPGTWWKGRMWSLRTTVAVSNMPSESDSFVMRGLDDLYSVARVDYRGVLSTEGWGTPIYGRLEASTDFGLTLVAIYLLAIGLGVHSVVRWLRRRAIEPHELLRLLVAFTVLFTVVVGAVAELGEQARFRTVTDPIATVVAVGWLWQALGRWRAQRQASDVGR
jgi:hypothetical protein